MNEDWELKTAFIRLDFPPDHRDVAHEMATLLAQFVGPAILRLRPEHTMGEILTWSDSSPVDTTELIIGLEEEFAHEISDDFAVKFAKRTFREFVEYWARLSSRHR
jgi:hypothetical protein